MKKVLMLALGITLTLIASAAYAQVTTGNVRGIVTDPNGAVVPNAKVTITQKSTNVSTTTQTTGSGPVGEEILRDRITDTPH